MAAKTSELGSVIALKGYDELARATGAAECDPSIFVVLCNGSTHFLVVEIIAPRGDDSTHGRLRASFAYGEDWQPAYSKALLDMAKRAVANR